MCIIYGVYALVIHKTEKITNFATQYPPTYSPVPPLH